MRPSTGWLLVLLVLGLAGCGPPGSDESPVVATPDPQLTADVAAAFATYRAGVVQGDADAVRASVDTASLADMDRVAALATTAGEEAVRALPAAEQLLVLTYRLRPRLLEADDPFAALVEGGFAGQDRSLGDLGEVQPAGPDRAVGVITDPQTGAPTALRWRFTREDGTWRFDLIDANRLLSQSIAAAAGRSGRDVDDLVAATVQDLSGEDADTVEALYAERPPS